VDGDHPLQQVLGCITDRVQIDVCSLAARGKVRSLSYLPRAENTDIQPFRPHVRTPMVTSAESNRSPILAALPLLNE
jgi:hypothetical protein